MPSPSEQIFKQGENSDTTLIGMMSHSLPSSFSDIDQSLDRLSGHKDRWINLELNQKITILDQIMEDFNSVAEEWVSLSMQAKGIPGNSFGEGEEWFNIAISNRLIRLYKESLKDILQHGKPQIPGPITTLNNGQLSIQVFPQKPIDRLLLRDTTCQMILEGGKTIEQVTENQAAIYRREKLVGVLTLILGAGNTSFLIPGDILAKLFGEGHAVLFKPNPINEYLGPLVEHAFQAVIEPGYMEVVYGGVEQGSYLTQHSLIDEIHMTGSHHTYNAIVFGPGEQGKQRKINKKPLLKKKFTAELGNITPVIVVPGNWTDNEIKSQGLKIATWLVYNGGFACPAPRLVIQHEDWPQREALNKAIAEAFTEVETRYAFYPGAEEIHKKFISTHPSALQYGETQAGHLPWTFIKDVDSSDGNEICFNEEPFCSILAETALSADSIPKFIERAVEFVNDHVWGTLHAILIVHPETAKDVQIASAFERGVQDLRYGTVSINQYPAISYYIGLTAWGGFPGQDIFDIQSGSGFVNNTLMLPFVQKSILRAPFNLSPDPFVVSTKRAHEFGAKIAKYEAYPSPKQLPSIIWTVLRSPHDHIIKKQGK